MRMIWLGGNLVSVVETPLNYPVIRKPSLGTINNILLSLQLKHYHTFHNAHKYFSLQLT